MSHSSIYLLLVVASLVSWRGLALIEDSLQLEVTGWELDEAHPGEESIRSIGRGLQSVTTITGLPKRFSIRSAIDPSLCVFRGDLTSRAVAAARAASGLPFIGTTDDSSSEYGSKRLVLLPCKGNADDTFLAETLLGRFYQNGLESYRTGFLKAANDNGLCAYGVNATYTDGHVMYGTPSTYGTEDGSIPDDGRLDWFDEYGLEYAGHLRYGYDPATMAIRGSHVSPNPLPATALDASGWGPFPAAWGACIPNPLVDSARPDNTPADEVEIQYHAWAFIDAKDSQSIAHLPKSVAKASYALLTIGPDRPQPELSPLAGEVDAGQLSADLGGSDKPYGTGYAAMMSNELCLTASTVKAGAELRLAHCNPATPAVQQVWTLASQRVGRKKK